MGKLSRNNKNLCGQTVLQLSMEGDEGATSINDVGLTEHSITFNGDADIIQSSTDPFGRSTGVLDLDGTGDYLEISNHEDFQFRDGDFTIESWIYMDTDTNSQCVFSIGTDSINFIRFASKLHFGGGVSHPCLQSVVAGVGEVTLCDESIDLSLNTWYHLAATRQGDIWRLFIDGILSDEQTVSHTVPVHTGDAQVGRNEFDALCNFVGQISNFRIIKGHALYTTNFSVPTNPFPKCFKPSDISSLVYWGDASKLVYNVASTTLATDGQSIADWQDRSGNGHTFAQATESKKPLFQTDEVNGRSVVQYQGGDDWLQATSKLIPIGAKSIVTVLKVNADSQGSIIQENDHNGSNNGFKIEYRDGTNSINATLVSPGTTIYDPDSTSFDSFDGNYHVITHTWDGTTGGGKVTLWIDGVLQKLDTSVATESVVGTINTMMGNRTAEDIGLNGNVVEMLVFNEALNDQDRNRIERYLSFKADVNTNPVRLCEVDAGTPNQVLLLHGEGPDGESDVLDSSSSAHTPSTNSGVVHTTSFKPFGFSGIRFESANSDYLEYADSADWDIGAVDATIECWFYLHSLGASAPAIFNQGSDSGAGDPGNYLQVSSTGAVTWFHSGDSPQMSATIPVGKVVTGKWYHVACVKTGLVSEIFLDGKSMDTGVFNSTAEIGAHTLKLGRHRNPGGSSWDYLDVTIKEFRWVKGTALYTENFKPKKNFYCDN
jgi:hypothetical protein